MRRLTHLVVLVAFIVSCDGHWAVFQCIAWANMVREYSQMVPLPQAVEMTFSGHYPCAICKAIAEKKSSEQQKSLAFEKYDKNFVPPVAAALAPPHVSVFQYHELAAAFSSNPEPPPTPPPRASLS